MLSSDKLFYFFIFFNKQRERAVDFVPQHICLCAHMHFKKGESINSFKFICAISAQSQQNNFKVLHILKSTPYRVLQKENNNLP